MPARLIVLLLVLPVAWPVLVGAGTVGTAACPQHFLDGTAPRLMLVARSERTQALCYEAFAILHSGLSRTPLYAAEQLTRAGVAAARTVDRVDAFHDEARLPPADRSEIEDYARSGDDRGHMAPAGDMPTLEAQAESFSLANVVPQDRTMNRNLWSSIEESVRRLARARGRLYVVTGPIFVDGNLQVLKGRILVPTRLFKAVYDPARGEGGAYIADNRADGTWEAVSLTRLGILAKIDPFPGLPPRVKDRVMDLPEPIDDPRPGARREADWGAWAKAALHRLLRHLWREVVRALF